MSTRKEAKPPRTRTGTVAQEPPPPGDVVLASRARVAIDEGVVGHAAAREALGCALASGHMPHAWIFHGPSGVGKCTAAVALAALVADSGSSAAERASLAPRKSGRSAEMMRAGTHPDVRIIRADLAGTSADRTLRERKQSNIPLGVLREHMIGGGERGGAAFDSPVHRSSFLGGGRVFIIDEAEKLETDGQNALLKTLEEPPAGTVIVLVTTSVDRLLQTIRSRCQRVAFHPLLPSEMSVWLDGHMSSCTGAERAFIEAFAAGSPGAALTAQELGMHTWHAELAPMIDRIAKGECPTTMSERMHEIASDVAEAAVKRDPKASKDAANRRAIGLLFALLGTEVRRRIGAGASAVGALDYWSKVPTVIARAETNIAANVNMKLALADFVAQWALLGKTGR